MADLSASIAIQLDGSAALQQARQLDRALDQLRVRAESVIATMRGFGGSLDLTAATNDARRFGTEIDAIKRKAQDAAAAMRGLGRSVPSAPGIRPNAPQPAAPTAPVPAPVPNVPTNVPGPRLSDANLSASQRMLSSLRTAADDIGGAFGRLQGSVVSLSGALQTLAGGMVLKNIAQAGMDLQTLKMTLTAVTGSSAEAEAAYQTLMEQSDRLGLKSRDLAEGMAQFIGASKGAGISAKDATAIFFNVAEGMAAIGTPAEKAKNAMFALQQMMSKPFASSEEINQQLGEAVPGAPAMIAAGLGLKDTGELMAQIEKRAISGKDAVMAFAGEITKQFPATTEAVNRAESQFNRLHNEISTLMETVANAGFLDALANGAVKLREALQTDEVKAMAVELGQNLGAAVDKAAGALVFLHNNMDTVRTVVEALIALKVAGWAANIAGAFGGLATTLARHPLLTIGAVALGAGTAFATLVNETGSVGGAVDELGNRIGATSQKLLDTVGASDAVKAKFAEIGSAADSAKPAVVSFLESFASDFMAGINRDIEAFGRAIGGMTGLFGDVSGRFQNVVTTIGGYFDTLVTKADETAERVGMPNLTFETALGESGRFFAGLTTGFSNADASMQDFVAKNVNNLNVLGRAFIDFVSGNLNNFRILGEGLVGFVDKGSSSFAALDGSMRDFVGKSASNISSIIGKLGELSGAVLQLDFSSVGRQADEFRDRLSSAFDSVKQNLSTIGQTITSSINFDGVKRSVDAFVAGIQQAIELVRSAANAVASYFAPAMKALDGFSSKVQSVWGFLKGNAAPVPQAPAAPPPPPKFSPPPFAEDAPLSGGQGDVLSGGQGSSEIRGDAGSDRLGTTSPLPGRKPTVPPGSQRVAGALALPDLKSTSKGTQAAPKGGGAPKIDQFKVQLSELQAQASSLQGISAAYDQGTAAVERYRQQQDLLSDVQRLNANFKPKQVEALRTELEKIQGLKLDVDFRQGMSELDDRIRSTEQLSIAQAEGGDAVRNAQASIEAYNQAVRLGVASDEARIASLKEKHKALLDVQAAAAVDAQVRGLNLQAEDTARLSDAVRSGSSYAIRDAEIENSSLAMGRQLGVENDPAQMDRIRQAQRSVSQQDQTLQGESRIRDMEIELEMVNRLAAAENLSGAAREGAMARIQAEAELKRQNIDVTTELSQRELDLADALGRANAKAQETSNALTELARSGMDGSQMLQHGIGLSLGHLEDALVGLVTGTMTAKEAFRSMAASIAADLARLAIRQMIMVPLAGALMGGFASGGVMGPAFASGGVMGARGVRAFASGGSMFTPTGVGGIARQPKMSLFGEGDTDEAYVPLTARGGSEIPLKRLSNGDYAVELPGGRSLPAEMKPFAQGGTMETLPSGDVPSMSGNSMAAIPPGEGGDTTNIAPNITVNVQMPQGGGSQEEGQRFGQAISRQIESRVIEIMRSQTRNGGILNPNGGY